MVQKRSHETRERVLEAATALVLERGQENVAMKDLVEASGVSNGSIFHHFGSKDGVLEEIFLSERRDYLGYVAGRILAFEGDPCDALGEGARSVILFQARDPERHFRLATQFVHSDFATRHTANSRELSAELERPVMEWAIPHPCCWPIADDAACHDPVFHARFGGTDLQSVAQRVGSLGHSKTRLNRWRLSFRRASSSCAKPTPHTPPADGQSPDPRLDQLYPRGASESASDNG